MYGSSSDPGMTLVLQSVGLPLGLCLLTVLAWLGAGRSFPRSERIAVPSIAILAAFWAAFSWIEGRLGLPPSRALDVIPLFGLAGVVLDQWQRLGGLRRPWSALLAVLVMGGLLFWLLKPILSRMETSAAIIQLALPIAIYLLCRWGLDRPALAADKVGVLLAMAAVAAPVIALGGTLKLGQMTGALAAALGAVWLIGFCSARCRNSAGWVQAPLMLLVALYASAYHYADVPAGALLLIPGLMPLLWLVRRFWPWASGWQDRLRTPVLSLIPLSLAVWWVWPQGSLY